MMFEPSNLTVSKRGVAPKTCPKTIQEKKVEGEDDKDEIND